MRPMLGDLELLQVQEISTVERRVLAEHKPPSMSGSLLQDMGRRPTDLALWGVAVGPESLDFVERLDSLFRNGEPISFIADIVADARIERVVIDDLRIEEVAGKPERYAYILRLREYIEPAATSGEPENTAAVDQAIREEAQANQETVVSQIQEQQGALEVTVELADPDADFSQVQVLVKGLTTEGTEYEVILNEQTGGVFRKNDLPAGEFTVSLLMAS